MIDNVDKKKTPIGIIVCITIALLITVGLGIVCIQMIQQAPEETHKIEILTEQPPSIQIEEETAAIAKQTKDLIINTTAKDTMDTSGYNHVATIGTPRLVTAYVQPRTLDTQVVAKDLAGREWTVMSSTLTEGTQLLIVIDDNNTPIDDKDDGVADWFIHQEEAHIHYAEYTQQ